MFNNPPARYDFSRDIVSFEGTALGSPLPAPSAAKRSTIISGPTVSRQDGRLEGFLKSRSRIELMARAKYLSWPVEEPAAVLIKTMDIKKLSEEISTAAPAAPAGRSGKKR